MRHRSGRMFYTFLLVLHFVLGPVAKILSSLSFSFRLFCFRLVLRCASWLWFYASRLFHSRGWKRIPQEHDRRKRSWDVHNFSEMQIFVANAMQASCTCSAWVQFNYRSEIRWFNCDFHWGKPRKACYSREKIILPQSNKELWNFSPAPDEIQQLSLLKKTRQQ